MTREEKNVAIEDLAGKLSAASCFYLTDTAELTVEKTDKLRRLCFQKEIELKVVKNTLLRKAVEKLEKDEYLPLLDTLKGPTSIMFTEMGNVPAKLIKEFRKTSKKPILKAAYIEECVYIGDDQLELLVQLKSKNELIADVIALLQSPAKNVIGALQSGGNKLSGILKTLSERSE